jgi:hypothetical protein
MMPFREYLEQVRPTVNRRIEEMAGDGEAVDPGVLPLLLKGKRMRAGLLLRVHTALTRMTVPTPRALDLACALEFAHAASLILDDMLDGDVVRRGAPAHHLTRGEGRAVLDAVGILALPYALAAPYGSQYVTMLASAQQSMTRGVAWEVLESAAPPFGRTLRCGHHQEDRVPFFACGSMGRHDGRRGRERRHCVCKLWSLCREGDADCRRYRRSACARGLPPRVRSAPPPEHLPGRRRGPGGRWHRCLMRRSPVRRPGSGCSLPGSRGPSYRRSGILWGSRSPAPASINTVPPQTLPEKRYRP